MKIRLDFVTNSSSSSYVILRRDDCSKTDILRALSEEYSHITERVKDNEDFKDRDIVDVLSEIADDLIKCTQGKHGAIEVDRWSLDVVELSSEDDSTWGLLYDIDKIETEKFRFISRG